jgi:hypothetical protein
MQPPPYSGMPTGPAPFWVFPVFESAIYLLFLFCFFHAFKQGPKAIAYLLGGLVFGLLLEYMEVATYSYSYGRFWIMIGRFPIDIPLCVGLAWGIIMYSARLFSDGLRLPLWAGAALDTIIALSIDLSMDTVACRLHLWNWNWNGLHINTMTTQWFGIPYANFVGWQTVVFCYSAFSRLFEPRSLHSNIAVWRAALIAVGAVVCSLAVLYGTEIYLFPVMNKLHVTSIYRFIGITVILLAIILRHWSKRKVAAKNLSALTWLIPGWFHLFFFASLFICGFYTEQLWMTVASCINLVIGIALHIWPLSLVKTKSERPIDHPQVSEIS